MDDDSLPPGVTRGPWPGRRQPQATPLLWIGPAITALLWASLAVSRWTRSGDGWTFVYVGCCIVSLVGVLAGRPEVRRLRRSTERSAAQQ